MPHVVLAELTRSGVVESVHHGSAVVVSASGEVILALGEPRAPVYPRSAVKPGQAVAMLRAGLDVDGPLLALVCASHSGERYHLDGVQRLLARAGLAAQDLQNTPDLPLDPYERAVWTATGRPPSALAQNCSGKHAGFLVTSVLNGWPVQDLLSVAHPVQQAVCATLADLAGTAPVAFGVDGCGAPTPLMDLTGLARTLSRVAAAADGPEQRVGQAMRTHPEWVGGTGREVTRLVQAVPGLLAKDGAEGVLAAALPDGTAVAVKIADGSARARLPVLVGLLRRLGLQSAGLEELAQLPVLGHGRPVGALSMAG